MESPIFVCAVGKNVEHFDQRREAHRCVNIAAWNVEVEAVSHQRDADQQQERQRQHLGGRMPTDKCADRPGRDIHHHHRDHDCNNHDLQLADETDRGDDRVDREHQVDHGDLDNHHRHDISRLGRPGPVIGAFDLVVDLVCALGEQEQAAGDQDDVAP
jgi:hypothetical protein